MEGFFFNEYDDLTGTPIVPGCSIFLTPWFSGVVVLVVGLLGRRFMLLNRLCRGHLGGAHSHVAVQCGEGRLGWVHHRVRGPCLHSGLVGDGADGDWKLFHLDSCDAESEQLGLVILEVVICCLP
jgi:hypothetical protein